MGDTRIRSPQGPFCPVGACNEGRKICLICLCYTSMDEEFHNDQILLKYLGKKISPSRVINEEIPFFYFKIRLICTIQKNVILNHSEKIKKLQIFKKRRWFLLFLNILSIQSIATTSSGTKWYEICLNLLQSFSTSFTTFLSTQQCMHSD